MSKEIFISYSRQEITFVDSLYQDLVMRHHVPLWLDFRELRVGEEWHTDIMNAIEVAHTLLLVVSSASIKSEHVAEEWQYAIQMGKRVILLIFEAVPLPDALKVYTPEWVDGRGEYAEVLRQLVWLLQQPITPPRYPAPQSGLIVPMGVTRLAKSVRMVSRMAWLGFTPMLFYAVTISDKVEEGEWVFVMLIGMVMGAIGAYGHRYARGISHRWYDFWQLNILFWVLLACITFGVLMSGGVVGVYNTGEWTLYMMLSFCLFLVMLGCFLWAFMMLKRISSGDVYRWSSPRTGFGKGLEWKKASPFLIGLMMTGYLFGVPLIMVSWWLAGGSIRHYRKQGWGASAIPMDTPTGIILTKHVANQPAKPTAMQKLFSPTPITKQLRIGIIYNKHDESVVYAIHQLVKPMNHLIVTPQFANCVIVLISRANPINSLPKSALQNGGVGVVIIPIILDDVPIQPAPNDGSHISLSATQALIWKHDIRMDALKMMLQDVHQPENRQYLPGQFPERDRPTSTPDLIQVTRRGMLHPVNQVITAVNKLTDPMQPPLDLSQVRTLVECMGVFGIDNAHLEAHRAGKPMPDDMDLPRKHAIILFGSGCAGCLIAIVLMLIESEFIHTLAFMVGIGAIVLIGVGIKLIQDMQSVQMILGGIQRSRQSAPAKGSYLVDCGAKKYSVKPEVWHRLWDKDVGMYRIYVLGDVVLSIEPAIG